jgi:hypothetical protein
MANNCSFCVQTVDFSSEIRIIVYENGASAFKGATTFDTMTLRMMTFSLMTLSMMTLSMMTFSLMTFSMMTLSRTNLLSTTEKN